MIDEVGVGGVPPLSEFYLLKWGQEKILKMREIMVCSYVERMMGVERQRKEKEKEVNVNPSAVPGIR